MAKRKMRTAGCFLEYEGRFVILHRRSDEPDGNTWGLPAGKVNAAETDEDAILREVEEETGYKASKEELEFLEEYIFDFPDLYLEFPTYRISPKEFPPITCNPREHTEFKWVTAQECDTIPNLIRGLNDLLRRTGYIKE